MIPDGTIGGSFRDPCGFVFVRDGTLYRRVNPIARDDYDCLMSSGLYEALTGAGMMVTHEEVDLVPAADEGACRILRPEPIPFVSYPYEWCFSQLKDAALITLAIQRTALEHGASLKDSSAFNVQFVGHRPVFIDTLSFERYREGEPWVAYRQFCEHFLAPLALMARVDVRASRLMRLHLDGIPLDLAATLLRRRTMFYPRLLLHIRLHARSQKRFSGRAIARGRRGRFGRMAFFGLLDSLESAVRNLSLGEHETAWSSYYEESSYSDESFEHKKRLLVEFLDQARPRTVWDLGANVGVFSRLASGRAIRTVSFDIDHACVEASYLKSKRDGDDHILPLCQDLTNPSPAAGWANQERMSLAERGPADAIFALALVHHLAIGNNVPLDRIAGFLRRIGKRIAVEFVPKTDARAQRLLASRQDIFTEYTRAGFEDAFGRYFELQRREKIAGSERILYLYMSKAAQS